MAFYRGKQMALTKKYKISKNINAENFVHVRFLLVAKVKCSSLCLPKLFRAS